jgi:hypothetical protein
MIQLLTDNKETLKKAHELFRKSTKLRCAVAFWGNGSENLFVNANTNNIKIICYLTSGGTNPSAIEDMMKGSANKTLRMFETLHAKVYWSEHGAIIGSANASVNGLGFENAELEGWKEASLFVDDPCLLNEIEVWFNEIWKQSSLIKLEDLKKAKISA